MGARGDLRHHAAEGGVLADLAEHDIGQDLAAAVLAALHHRRGGLVAGGLDAEDDHSVPVIPALSPSLRELTRGLQ